MKIFLRPRVLIAFFAAVFVGGFISDYYFKWAPSSRSVLAWVRTNDEISRRFGDVDAAAIAKQTDYRSPETGLRERKYVILIDGSVAEGRVVVVDTKPGSAHAYRLERMD